MTKNELINRVNELTSQFLGFKTEMAGISQLNKATLETIVDRLEKGVELRSRAAKIASRHARSEFDVCALFPNDVSTSLLAEYNEYVELMRQADEYWFNLKG